MKKTDSKEEPKSEAQIKIENTYNSILNKAQKLQKPIGPLFTDDYLHLALDDSNLRRSGYSKQEEGSFPKDMRGRQVCKLEIKALENYDSAYQKFVVLIQPMYQVQKYQKGQIEPLKKEDQRKEFSRLLYSNQGKIFQKNYKKCTAYVSNKQIIVFDGGKNQPRIQAKNFRSFVIQTRQDYQDLILDVTHQLKRIKNFSKKEKKSFFSSSSKSKILTEEGDDKIKQIEKRFFMLLQNWSEGTRQSTVRIICIYDDKNPKIPLSNFCIYSTDFVREENKRYLTKKDAQEIVQKMSLAVITDRNNFKIKRICDRYKQQTKKIVTIKTIQFALQRNLIKPEQRKIFLNNKDRIFNEYDRIPLEKLIKQWKERAYLEQANSKQYLIIEPHMIKLPKEWMIKKIYLKIDNSDPLYLKFEEYEQNSSIFTYDKDENREDNYHQEFEQETRKKYINFNLVIEVENSSNQGTHDIIQLQNTIQMFQRHNEQLGFSYSLALNPKKKYPQLSQNADYSYILNFQVLVAIRGQKLPQMYVHKYRSASLMTHLGKIPNIFSRYSRFDFNPNNYQFIASIFQQNPPPLSKAIFQKAYIRFVKFFNDEQCNSQNYCEKLKFKGIKNEKISGLKIEDRYDTYKQILSDQISQVKSDWKRKFGNAQFPAIRQITRNKHLINMRDDVEKYSSPNKQLIQGILQKYIIYCEYANEQKSIKHWRCYTKGLIKIADRIIELFDRAFSRKNNQFPDSIDVFYFFVAFIIKLYPYSYLLDVLQKDLYHSRFLMQNYLPQFNRTLNRKGIGLENFVSQHLLHLFTNLPMELSYRIWDYLIGYCNNEVLYPEARLTVIFTIMVFQEKSSLLPIYPINIFIQAVHKNFDKIKMPPSAVQPFVQNMRKFSQKRKERREKIQMYAEQKLISRLIFGKYSDEADISADDGYEESRIFQGKNQTNSRIQSRLRAINKLPYPTIQPTKIVQITIFMSGIFIEKELNFKKNTYKLIFKMKNMEASQQIQIWDKFSFSNKPFTLKVPYNKEIAENLQVFVTENQKKIMGKEICLINYHKNTVYRQYLTFQQEKGTGDRLNMGSSCISLSFILQSEKRQNFQEQILDQFEKKEDEVFEKLLDYDLSAEHNEIVKEMKELDRTFMKILEPANQMDSEQSYSTRLTATFKQVEAEWISNSNVSNEELKQIFAEIFHAQKDKQYREGIFNFFEDYTEGQNKFMFGKFILQLILTAPLSKIKKLSLIYCAAAHYENNSEKPGTQKVTVKTLNSLIKQILLNHGVLNACPFANKYSGRIVSGCFYLKSSKNNDQKKRDITKVLEDWGYLCQMKSKYGGMILGTASQLKVLRAMLPRNILDRIQAERLCRFEIIFQKEGSFYAWSATVNTNDFTVAHRGVKIIDSYPIYRGLKKSLNSLGNTLMNYENVIPLQTCTSLTFQQFCDVFHENSLLDYLLTIDLQSISFRQQRVEERQKFIFSAEEISQHGSRIRCDQIYHLESEKQQQYTDFGIYRYQNGYKQWRRCKLVQDKGNEDTYVQVMFEGCKALNVLDRSQLISMEDNYKHVSQLSESRAESIYENIG